MSHERSAPEIFDRYPNTRLWAPVGALAEMLKRTRAVTDWFAPGDALPGGMEAHATVLPGAVVLWLPEHRALVPADVIDGIAGRRALPPPWLLACRSVSAEAQRDALLPLLDLPVDLVLVSHGEPLLGNGSAALAQPSLRK